MAAKGSEATGVTAKALAAAMKSILGDKSKASEFNGAAGRTQQQFMKEHSLDRTAFNLILKLEKQEPQNQQATLRGVIEYAHKAGMFDEVDAFDDLISRMKEIAAEVEKRRHNGKAPDPIVGAVTGK